jgi:hypothetical protein
MWLSDDRAWSITLSDLTISSQVFARHDWLKNINSDKLLCDRELGDTSLRLRHILDYCV